MAKTCNGNYRPPRHDYTQRHIYHITFKKRTGTVSFGTIAGDWCLPKDAFGRSHVKASPPGAIIKTCLQEINTQPMAIFQLSNNPFKEQVVGHRDISHKILKKNRDRWLCVAWRLLPHSLGLPTATILSRAICIPMNALAASIATPEFISHEN